MGLSRRTTAAVALALAIPASVFGMAALGSEAGAEVGAGPVATAAARDLKTTETITGALARAGTKTIVYGGIIGAGGNLRIAATEITAVKEESDQVASDACPSPSPTPSDDPSPAPTPHEGPSPSPSPTPSDGPSPSPSPSPEESPGPCPSPSPTPSPTPTPDPPPTQEPPAQLPVQDQPQPQLPVQEETAGAEPRANQPADQSQLPNADQPAEPARAATLTGVMDVGSVAGRGSVLYSADTEPVAALLAPEALYRDLSTVSTDGDDIKALEENLSALGHGAGMTVDRHFDSATASAVKRWEQDLKRLAPDGTVSVGEVVFIPEPAAVISRRAVVGDKLNIGTPVLTLGTQSRVVTAMVDVDSRDDWAAGKVVELHWADRPGTGTVTEVGRDEVGGQLGVTIALGQDAPDVPIGTEVEAWVTTAEKSGVVTVPVSAIVDWADEPAVRLVGKSEDSIVPVKLGIVSGGLAEITEGLKAGTKVRLPG